MLVGHGVVVNILEERRSGKGAEKHFLGKRKKTKRDGNTEITEGRTQRAQRTEKRRRAGRKDARGRGVGSMDGAEKKVDGGRRRDGWGDGGARGVGEEDAAVAMFGAAEAGDAGGTGGTAGCGIVYGGAESHGV
jgi:hypothetical protein